MQTRRTFIKNTGLLSAAVLSSTLTARAFANQNDQKKNLLFIITDQQRYDALSYAGNTVLQTPNLDRIAREGAYFENAYSPCPVCGPARASILTGCTIENTGVLTNNHTYDYEEEGLMIMPTFDEILTDNGYHCEYYGKWHCPSFRAETYQNPIKSAKNGKSIFGSGGQSHIYMDYLNQHEDKPPLHDGQFYENMTKRPYVADPLDKYYGKTAAELTEQNLKHIQPDQHGKLLIDKEHTLTAFQARQTIDAIERLQDVPFSITCSFHYPHSPIVPVEPYYSMYPAEEMLPPESIDDDRQYSPHKNANGVKKNPEYADPDKIKYMISNYYGLVKEIDDWVGKILDKLDELGLTENTLVIFTSDHGEMLGAHGLREKNIFYEESVHIPLLMRFPNEIAPTTTVDGYTSLIDLFPTLLDYLKIEAPKSDGKSLRGLIEGTDDKYGKYAVAEWDWRGDTEANYMIVKDGWKLIIPYTRTSGVISALYDLNTDPYELDNLISSRQKREQQYDKLEELKVCLLEWLIKNNSRHYDGVNALLGKLTGADDKPNVPSDYELGQNYPNPFNPTTTIQYNLPQAGHVELDIFDSTGRQVKTLVRQIKSAGTHLVEFDAGAFPSGQYFCRIQTGAFTDTKKIVLQR